MKKLFILWVARLRAKTPAFWNFIKTVFGWVPIGLSVINTSTSGTLAPDWYTKYQFYISGSAALILLIAQSQTKKETTA